MTMPLKMYIGNNCNSILYYYFLGIKIINLRLANVLCDVTQSQFT